MARMEVESKAEVGVGFSPGSASDTIVPVGGKERNLKEYNERINGKHLDNGEEERVRVISESKVKIVITSSPNKKI